MGIKLALSGLRPLRRSGSFIATWASLNESMLSSIPLTVTIETRPSDCSLNSIIPRTDGEGTCVIRFSPASSRKRFPPITMTKLLSSRSSTSNEGSLYGTIPFGLAITPTRRPVASRRAIAMLKFTSQPPSRKRTRPKGVPVRPAIGSTCRRSGLATNNPGGWLLPMIHAPFASRSSNGELPISASKIGDATSPF